MTPIPSFVYKKANNIAMIIFVPIFALLFIVIYRPFNFEYIDEDAGLLTKLNISRDVLVMLITIGFILIGMAVVAISRWIMTLYTRAREISYIAYISWVACEVLIMAFIFTVSALFTDTNKSFSTLFYNSLVKTFFILLIPYVMCYIYFIWQERVAQLRSIRERLAEDENALQAAYIQIFDEKGELRLSVRREHLLLLESADNYVCVWYINNSAPKKILVRNTLTRIAKELETTHIQRCHRSYIINLDLIKVMRREKEGIYVEFGMDGVPDVPISKTYLDSINKWLIGDAN